MLDQLYNFIEAQFHNQFLTGGVVTVAFGAVLAILRPLPGYLWALLRRKLLVVVDVADHDKAFFWLQFWLSNNFIKKSGRLLSLSTRQAPLGETSGSNYWSRTNDNTKHKPTLLMFAPAPGNHLFFFKGYPILLECSRSSNPSVTGEVAHHDTLYFYSFSRKIIEELIQAAQLEAEPPEEQRITVYQASYDTWRAVLTRKPRSLESVVLATDLRNSLVKDLERFYSAESWYDSTGIPYQRGYLFHGPPGNGKTSLVLALASHFGRDVYVINPNQLAPNYLGALMAGLPDHAMILVEDIDSFYDGRKAATEETVDFGLFINAIDGAFARQGRVLFITTNHVEKLDPALTRPGRADLKVLFNNATSEQARNFFLRFFPNENARAQAFGRQVQEADREYSMADLQEHLVKNWNDPLAASTLCLEKSKRKTRKVN